MGVVCSRLCIENSAFEGCRIECGVFSHGMLCMGVGIAALMSKLWLWGQMRGFNDVRSALDE